MTDYYKVLGLSKDAPQTQIRSRFRLLSFIVHPDLDGKGKDPQQFARYTEAYKVLGNPKRRQEYNAQFGISIKPRSLKPGHDLYQRLSVSSDQAEHGTVATLNFLRYDPCSLCWCEGCHRCNYQGLIPSEATAQVRVPANIKHTTTVFIEGEGGQTEPGGPRGNLLVYIDIAAS